MNYAFTSDEVRELGDEQKDAIMESLVVAVLADGRAPRLETAVFDAQVDAVPWGLEREEIKRRLEAARAKVVGLTGAEPAMALIGSIAARLPSPTIREKMLRAIAAILWANKDLSRPEATVMAAFASAFALPQDRLDAIKASVKGT